MLRLNTGVPPTTTLANVSRLGLLGGDAAGYPNARRLMDDVVDISLRVVAGVLVPGFNVVPNNRLGDGVNVNDVPYRTTFPYLSDAPSGRDRRHIDPGEPGCTMGAGAACAPLSTGCCDRSSRIDDHGWRSRAGRGSRSRELPRRFAPATRSGSKPCACSAACR